MDGMIITRAPLRLSFGGGGTDLPSYYRKFGGDLVAGAINKYVYISLHETFGTEFIIKYSQYEKVASAIDVKHPVIREILQNKKIDPKLEMVSFADIPDGTGLGSSGAFTVALLKAISVYQRRATQTHEIAKEACQIEIERLGDPIGKQDQYASAFGGISRYIYNKDDSVEVYPLNVSGQTISDMESNLLLFFTGFNRRATTILSDQKTRCESLDEEMLKNLHFTKELGRASFQALESGNLNEFARLMDIHWQNKRKRSPGMSKDEIDHAYAIAKENGALGGKLIGAGGGGFLMFYTQEHSALRTAMQKLGLREVVFKFDFEGVKSVNL